MQRYVAYAVRSIGMKVWNMGVLIYSCMALASYLTKIS